MNNSVLVHYHSHQGNYFNMSLWQWQDGKLGKDAFFHVLIALVPLRYWIMKLLIF